MRRYFPLILMILLICGLAVLPSCGGGEGGGGSTGVLIADFDLEGEDFVADPLNPAERLCMLFHQPAAYALSDLSWDSNSYPLNQFTSPNNVEAGLRVILYAPGMAFIGETVTNSVGQITFNDAPTGYLILRLIGQNGNTYDIPVHVQDGSTSRTRARVYRDFASGNMRITGKTIHDSDGNGENDDDFSYALYGRPRNQSSGGQIFLHINGQTRVDANGDSDFEDGPDYTVTEPDDDAVSSDEGDGDEDNDGIIDPDDSDIDGDDNPNITDPDMDGDGIENLSDPFPAGESPNDDYDPPAYQSDEYPGVYELEDLGDGVVAVHYPRADEEDGVTFTYNIYYAPFEFEDTADALLSRAVHTNPQDDMLQSNIGPLPTTGEWWFLVRVQDEAQPPNEDENFEKQSIPVD